MGINRNWSIDLFIFCQYIERKTGRCFFIKGKKDISELKKAVNELYRLNDALRIQITETDGKPMQSIREFAEQDIDVLHFKSREELTQYGETYAKVPLDLYG